MMKTLFKLILLGSLFSCASAKIYDQSEDINLKIEIKHHRIENGENIIFTIKNISSKALVIIKPTIIHIEKLQEGIWKKIRILYCPCDAPCQAPDDEDILSPQNQIESSWDQMESWCGENTDGKIRNSIYEYVGTGQYRIQIIYKNSNDNFTTVYSYFRIKK